MHKWSAWLYKLCYRLKYYYFIIFLTINGQLSWNCANQFCSDIWSILTDLRPKWGLHRSTKIFLIQAQIWFMKIAFYFWLLCIADKIIGFSHIFCISQGKVIVFIKGWYLFGAEFHQFLHWENFLMHKHKKESLKWSALLGLPFLDSAVSVSRNPDTKIENHGS